MLKIIPFRSINERRFVRFIPRNNIWLNAGRKAWLSSFHRPRDKAFDHSEQSRRDTAVPVRRAPPLSLSFPSDRIEIARRAPAKIRRREWIAVTRKNAREERVRRAKRQVFCTRFDAKIREPVELVLLEVDAGRADAKISR